MPFSLQTSQSTNPEIHADILRAKDGIRSVGNSVILPAGSFVPDSAASTAFVSSFSALTLPDSGSANNRGSVTFVKPEIWYNGTLRATVYYTSSAGGDFRVQGLFIVSALGESVATSSGSETNTMTAVSGANELGAQEFSIDAEVNASDSLISFRVLRDGTDAADTSVSDLNILAVRITFFETRVSA